MVSLDWKDYVVIIYASLQTLGLLCTVFWVIFTSTKKCCDKIKEIWKLKWTYVSSLSTMYDQASDIGVLIYWFTLIGNDAVDGINLNMTGLFIAACIVCLLSRLFAAYGMSTMCLDDKKTIGYLVGFFDLHILLLVWITISNKTKNWFKKKDINESYDVLFNISQFQMFEAITESLPQIILQSFFLVRTYDNTYIYGSDGESSSSVLLVWASLLFSIISVSNKYSDVVNGNSKEDRELYENNWYFRCGCPCFNMGLLFLKFYFIATSMTRIFLYALIWSVVGGLFVGIFIFLSIFSFVILACFGIMDSSVNRVVYLNGKKKETKSTCCENFAYWLVFDAFGVATRWQTFEERNQFIVHNIINIIGYIMAILFSVVITSYDCGDYNICSDPQIRDFRENEYVLILVIVCGVGIVLQSIFWIVTPFVKKCSQTEQDGVVKATADAVDNSSKQKNDAQNSV